MMLVGFDWDFVFEDMSQLYKIFIVGWKGECLILVCNENGGWDLEGVGLVNLYVMEFLFEVIRNVCIKYKFFDNVVKNMVNVLVIQGKKVELYDKVGNLFKVYYIGGFIVDECGIYIIMDGVEQFYVVEMLGFLGNFSVCFD